MSATRNAALGDALALGLSGLCLAHCLALPLLAALLPLLGTWSEAEWVHWAFAGVAAPLSLWTLQASRPASRRLIGLGGVGVLLLFFGAAGFPAHQLETPVTTLGSLILASAHVLNWRRRRSCGASPLWKRR